MDGSGGCSVKDSFGCLDLSAEGFRLLFEAEWLHREPSPRHSAGDGRGWQVVRTPGELDAWGAAHGGGPVFRPALLEDLAVAVVMLHDGRQVVAGAVGNRTGSVVGVSNLFTTSADVDGAWAGATAAITGRLGDLPLVGYEHGASLEAAHRAGFVSVGGLRVWLRD